MFGKKEARIRELESTLRETRAQLKRLEEERGKLENISRRDRERVVDLTDESKKLTAENQRLKVMEKALQELQALQEREKAQKEAIVELIIDEESIISLIQQAKSLLAEIVNLLRFVLEKHPDLKDRISEYVTEYREVGEKWDKRSESYGVDVSIRNMAYEMDPMLRGFSHGEMQKAVRRSFISIAGTFMVLYNAVHQLMLLVKEERRNAAIVKKCDEFVLSFMNGMYRNIYYTVHRNLPYYDRIRVGYADIELKTVELSEHEMKYISEQGSKQQIIDKLNKRITEMIREILSMLNSLRNVITAGGDQIGKIYPEFSRIKAGLLTNLQKLFVVFVEHINKNSKLASRIVELNDRSIIEAQKEFNAFLRHFGDNFDDSIRQMELNLR